MRTLLPYTRNLLTVFSAGRAHRFETITVHRAPSSASPLSLHPPFPRTPQLEDYDRRALSAYRGDISLGLVRFDVGIPFPEGGVDGSNVLRSGKRRRSERRGITR